MSEESNEQQHEDASQVEGKSKDVDAMGRDKRRGVIGGQYGATVRKQLTVYGAFIAVVGLLGIVALTVISGYDNREIPLENTAPWAKVATQDQPRPVDFPENGPENTIPREEIGKTNLPG
jgi:hypothetical protein